MAFFKFRKGGDEQAAPTPAPESIETLRRRARYRLAGAFVLVMAGVIGFPLLFDNQPRPIAVDIPIDIPDKAKSRPAVVPAPAGQVGTGGSGTATAAAEAARASAGAVVADASKGKPAQKTEEVISPANSAVKVAEKPVDKPAEKAADKSPEKPQDKGVVKPEPKSAAKPDEAAKAQALLEGKPVTKTEAKAEAKPADKAAADKPSANDKGRFVVQFGAYTDAVKAHDIRMKVERIGLKTYTHAIQGPQGKTYRLRVGPYERRGEAEKAAEKIKKLDLPASILEL